MVRTPYIDENGLKKGAWSAEEDEKLRAYIQRYGHWNWRELPKYAGLARCGKSCRLRWINYLRPNVKHGDYNEEEEELIIKLHKQLGNRWSAIAGQLPGRTDNEIKNYWHTHLKKRVHQRQPNANKGQKRKLVTRKLQTPELVANDNCMILEPQIAKPAPSIQIVESFPIYPETFSCVSNEYIYSEATGQKHSDSGSGSDLDLDLNLDSSSSMGFEEGATSPWDALGELVDESFWNESISLENNQHQEIEFNFDLEQSCLSSSPYMFLENMNFPPLL